MWEIGNISQRVKFVLVVCPWTYCLFRSAFSTYETDSFLLRQTCESVQRQGRIRSTAVLWRHDRDKIIHQTDVHRLWRKSARFLEGWFSYLTFNLTFFSLEKRKNVSNLGQSRATLSFRSCDKPIKWAALFRGEGCLRLQKVKLKRRKRWKVDLLEQKLAVVKIWVLELLICDVYWLYKCFKENIIEYRDISLLEKISYRYIDR